MKTKPLTLVNALLNQYIRGNPKQHVKMKSLYTTKHDRQSHPLHKV